MPALPPIPGVLRLDIEWQVGSDLGARTRTFWNYSGTPPSNATCAALATIAYNAIVAQMIPYVHPDNALLGCVVTDLTTSSSGTGSHIATTIGTRAGNPLPAEAAFLLNMRIGRRYRGGKPRIYLPYGSESDVLTPQLWQVASLANFTSSWATGFVAVWVGSSSGGTIVGAQVNVSYYAGFTSVLNPITGRTRDVPKVRAVAIAPDVVTSYAGNPKIASQRRRELHSV